MKRKYIKRVAEASVIFNNYVSVRLMTLGLDLPNLLKEMIVGVNTRVIFKKQSEITGKLKSSLTMNYSPFRQTFELGKFISPAGKSIINLVKLRSLIRKYR
jgi:hypothetical protein